MHKKSTIFYTLHKRHRCHYLLPHLLPLLLSQHLHQCLSLQLPSLWSSSVCNFLSSSCGKLEAMKPIHGYTPNMASYSVLLIPIQMRGELIQFVRMHPHKHAPTHTHTLTHLEVSPKVALEVLSFVYFVSFVYYPQKTHSHTCTHPHTHARTHAHTPRSPQLHLLRQLRLLSSALSTIVSRHTHTHRRVRTHAHLTHAHAHFLHLCDVWPSSSIGQIAILQTIWMLCYPSSSIEGLLANRDLPFPQILATVRVMASHASCGTLAKWPRLPSRPLSD